jgi:F-type H+-transporting ATPase subunit a
MNAPHVAALANVTVGEHITWRLFGLTFNGDTIWSTLVAGLVVVILGLMVARSATHEVPGKLQVLFETIVQTVQDQVESTIGPVAPFVVPLAVTLFVFILVANWIEIIPSYHHPEYLPAPTADVNLTYAMALVVIALVHVTGIRQRGFRRYFSHFAQPYKFLLPVNIIEEVAKPVTLALRLFGNIFSGGIMILLLSIFPATFAAGTLIGDVIWKPFDMFIGLIQAFIFALLTILYFAFAVGDSGH